MDNNKTLLEKADLYRDDKVTITRGNILHNLYIGGSVNKYPGYTFLAKIYGEPSAVGLEGGRIVQLVVRDPQEQLVFSYDRGSKRGLAPSNEIQKAIEREIIEAFPPVRTAELSHDKPSGVSRDFMVASSASFRRTHQHATGFFRRDQDLER